MIQPVFTKRDSNAPSSMMSLEYKMLEDKMALLSKRDGDDSEDYYTSRRSEIEMSWVESESYDLDKGYVWHASMPLPLWQCAKIFESAKKLPSRIVEDLYFSDYEMNAIERQLFDVIVAYGRARGLEIVAEQLYAGAESGDPRAVKMYLEVMKVIGVEEEVDETKGLMRVSIDLGI